MKPKLVITVLTAIFVLPIVVSWLLVNSGYDWTASGLSNRGVLIRPAINLGEKAAMEPVFNYANLAPSEWAIVYLEQESCLDACRAHLEQLSIIHSVIGSAKSRLQYFALAPATDKSAHTGEKLLLDPGAVTALTDLLKASQSTIEFPQFVVIDWRRQLMLRFPQKTESIDIKKDLKKLLRGSKIR